MIDKAAQQSKTLFKKLSTTILISMISLVFANITAAYFINETLVFAIVVAINTAVFVVVVLLSNNNYSKNKKK